MMRISRHVAWCWVVRGGGESAQIFVRHGFHNGVSGFHDGTTWISVAILSSYGSWAYHWQNCGPTHWRTFLAGLEEDYAMDKFMGQSRLIFSPERTLQAARATVLRDRRQGLLNTYVARAAWETVDDLIRRKVRDQRDIIEAFATTRAFQDSYWEMPCYEPRPEGTAFWKNIWVPWINHILAEPQPQ